MCEVIYNMLKAFHCKLFVFQYTIPLMEKRKQLVVDIPSSVSFNTVLMILKSLNNVSLVRSYEYLHSLL